MMKNRIVGLPFIVSVCLVAGFQKNRPLKTFNRGTYEVRITYTGYALMQGTLADCQIRSNGKVILTGLVAAEENVRPEDDITYRGTLQMTIDMDICSAKRLANGEDKLCSMTATGSGLVKTELEIYSDGQDQARGAYIKIQYDSTLGQFQRSVVGNCDHNEMVEEENMVPNESVSSIFNGREMNMLTDRRLLVKRYVERDGDTETVVDVLRKVK